MFSQAKNQLSASATLVLALILSILVVIPLTPERATAAAGDGTCNLASLGATGNGNVETPWGISTSEQLWEITDCPGGGGLPGGNFVLLQDINVSDALAGTPTQSPIGLNGTEGTGIYSTFEGVLDGKGHTISFSMDINGGAALFHSLDKAEIRNLTLSGTIRSNPTSALYSGGVALDAINQNTISNVTVALDIQAKSHVGGFVGLVSLSNARLTILDSKFTGSLQATGGMSGGSGYVGGFVGRANSATLIFSGSSSLGLIAAPSAISVGGFVGQVENSSVAFSGLTRSSTVSGETGSGGIIGVLSLGVATLSGVTNLGDVQAPGSSNVGGIVGFSSANLSIGQTHNFGSVSGDAFSGGFLGSVTGTTTLVRIANSSNKGNVETARNSVGGFIGSFSIGQSTDPRSSLVLENLTNSGSVRSNSGSGVGGIFGFTRLGNYNLNNLSNTGTVSAQANGGEVAGIGAHSQPTAGFFATELRNSGSVTGNAYLGGLFARVGLTVAETHVTISNSINSGTVSGLTTFVGGIAGEVTQFRSAFLNLSRVGNQAPILGTSHVGGLIGISSMSSTTIQSSFNSGEIDGSSNRVGGLSGQTKGVLTVVDASSTGTIKGWRDVGGLVGTANPSANLTRVFTVATVSATSGLADGLDGGTLVPTTTSAFTSTTSRYAGTTELQEFYSVGLYTGWDFETVWAFGECAVLGELPVLRWANPNKTFSTTSCFVVVDSPSEESTQAGSSDNAAAVAPPTASYQGPMLLSATTIVFRAEVAELFGTKLEAVTTAELQGLTLLILAATSTSITLEIPAGADLGIHDLVLLSSFGRLTVMNSLDVRAGASANQFGELLGFQWAERYAGNSRTLSQQQSDSIVLALPRFSGVTTIVCWGYTTAADPNEWAIAHAAQRAASVCRDIQRLQPDVKTHVRVRFGVTKSAALRASMQFWELRVAN